MAQSRLSQEELEQLTGGFPGTEEVTPGKAIVSALKDTLGYAVNPGAAATRITKSDAIERMMQHSKEALSPTGSYFHSMYKALKKSVGNTRKSVLDWVKDIEYDREGLNGNIAQFDPSRRVITISKKVYGRPLDSPFGPPAILGHELGHVGIDRIKGDLIHEFGRDKITLPLYGYTNQQPNYPSPEDFRSMKPGLTARIQASNSGIDEPYYMQRNKTGEELEKLVRMPHERMAESHGRHTARTKPYANDIYELGPSEQKIWVENFYDMLNDLGLRE